MRKGAVLLEVIIALAILGLAGAALLGAVLSSQRALEHARVAEQQLMGANAFLSAVSLWPTEDLDRRLGWRAQGTWMLYIERSEPTLYLALLADSSANRPLIRTVLYRPRTNATR